MSTGNHPRVQVFKPDYSLKNKVGVSTSVRDIFTPAVIAECQKLIEDFKDNFFFDSLDELKTIEQGFRSKTLTSENKKQALVRITALKTRSESLGFMLLADLLDSLETYTESLENLPKMPMF